MASVPGLHSSSMPIPPTSSTADVSPTWATFSSHERDHVLLLLVATAAPRAAWVPGATGVLRGAAAAAV